MQETSTMDYILQQLQAVAELLDGGMVNEAKGKIKVLSTTLQAQHGYYHAEPGIAPYTLVRHIGTGRIFEVRDVMWAEQLAVCVLPDGANDFTQVFALVDLERANTLMQPHPLRVVEKGGSDA